MRQLFVRLPRTPLAFMNKLGKAMVREAMINGK